MSGGMVYIIEGVAGAGKDTLADALVAALEPSQRQVLMLQEGAVLASWHHYYLPGIDSLRLDLTEALAASMQTTLAADPEAVFICNRFHVSHAVWRTEKQNNQASLEARHRRLVAQLHELPVVILHPVLGPEEVEARTRHTERRDLAWQRFLARRAADMGFPAPWEMYAAQQKMMAEVLDRDGLPYQDLRVAAGQTLDIDGLTLRL